MVNQCLTVSIKNKSSLIPPLPGLQGLLLANNLVLFLKAEWLIAFIISSSLLSGENDYVSVST